MKSSRVLGIMSGTSIDSVDYALCRVSDSGVKLERLWSVDFPTALRQRLHRAASNDADSWEVGQLHHDLGRFYAVNAAPGGRCDFVGLHGQTIFHNPDKRAPGALQLGEPAYLVERLRVPVVNNFRSLDIAAGGQGAPLATIFHQWVFVKKGEHVCVNNLGGISNVTSMDWRNTVGRGPRRAFRESNVVGGKGSAGASPYRGEPKVLAFDTGPANVLIDLAVRHFSGGKNHFDENGSWAARGKVSHGLVRDWLSHEYFRAKPPKSTGRELFGEPFFVKALKQMKGLSKFDVVATFTEFTARSLALNYQRFLPSIPQTIVLSGGGAANPQLVRAIVEQFPPMTKVVTSDSLGWPVQAIEPAAFALLAWLRMNRIPGNLPETTGARRAVLCGTVTE